MGRLSKLLRRDDIPDDVRALLTEFVDARQSSEDALRRTREVLDNIIDLNPYAMAVFDLDGHCTRSNQAFARLFVEPPPAHYSIFDDPILRRHGYQEAVLRIADGETFDCPELWYDPNEFLPEQPPALVCIHFSFFPAFDAAGHTERKRGEERLAQAEKMTALGTLAGGVAHEFNNINTTVLGYADLLLRGADLSAATRGMVERVRHAATRARDITEGLLTFAGRRGEGMIAADLAQVAREVLELFGRQLRTGGIEIDVRLDREAAAVLDPALIGQVILNLLINSRDALAGRTDPLVRISVGEDSSAVWLKVADNGCGIPKDALPRIFTPFFSTKGEHAPPGSVQASVRGTGLGLSVSHSIVENHGGALVAESAAGVGTTITLRLPKEPPRAPRRATPPRGRPRPAPSHPVVGTVVVIEDDADVRDLLCEQLASAGHRVRGTDDAVQVLADLEREAVDVVVADVAMPKLSGPTFLRRLQEIPERRRPRPIVITGGDVDPESDVFSGCGRFAFLRKPFTAEVLQREVAISLTGRKRSG